MAKTIDQLIEEERRHVSGIRKRIPSGLATDKPECLRPSPRNHGGSRIGIRTRSDVPTALAAISLAVPSRSTITNCAFAEAASIMSTMLHPVAPFPPDPPFGSARYAIRRQ